MNIPVLLRIILDIRCCEKREWYLQMKEISTVLSTRENMTRAFSHRLPQRRGLTYEMGVFRRSRAY